MQIIKQIKQIRSELDKVGDKKIAFVPTMGNLHDGHLHLVKQAKELAQIVVVSIFVNQKQFNNQNDFAKYPRTLEDDISKLEAVGVDFIFAPDHQEIYPQNSSFQIIPDKNLSDCLCGKTRVGHMEGVCLVVAKLFNIVKPNFALFGKKDFQQFSIIKKMVEELNFDIEIIGVETVREESGLAMSSRNNLLSEKEKLAAANIYRILHEIKDEIKNNQTQFNLATILEIKEKKLLESGFNKIDYLEIRDEKNLKLINDFSKINNPSRIFIAAFLGEVRLIDNLVI